MFNLKFKKMAVSPFRFEGSGAIEEARWGGGGSEAVIVLLWLQG